MARRRRLSLGCVCVGCGVAFTPIWWKNDKVQIQKRKTCSPQCGLQWKLENRPHLRLRHIACRECGILFTPIKWKTESDTSRYQYEVYHGATHCSVECRKAASIRIGAYLPRHRGSDHYAWKGGIKHQHMSGYRGPDWDRIRENVLKRDGYKCVDCGSTTNLHVDHIVPFHNFRTYREANKLSNLETRCASCHPIAEAKRVVQFVLPLWKRDGPRGSARGTRNSHAKLTEPQVLSIRRDQRPIKVIAAEYGVHKSLVYQIRNREAWSWLLD